MNSRHKAHDRAVDSVERLCVGVWLTGHFAAVFTLCTLIADDHKDLATAHRPAATRPDADLDATERKF